MGRDKIRIAGADELPRDEQPEQSKHPFGKLNRAASRNEVVNASMNAARAVYDQIADEHNKAINDFYTEFEEYREVSARRIRQIERWSISYQIQRALRVDTKRLSDWRAARVQQLRDVVTRLRGGSTLEQLAREAARVHEDVPVELINQLDVLAMIRSGVASALRWTGNVDDLKDGPFHEFYHEGMIARSDGAIPIRDGDGTEELCCIGDLLLLKNGELSVVKAAIAQADAQKEAAS